MKLIINIPGSYISAPTFNSIFRFVSWANQYKDFQVIMNNGSSSHVGFAREKLVGYTKDYIFPPEWQDYDYQLWIDSDIEFDHKHFEMLYDDKQDIVSGYYRMADGRNKCCVLLPGKEEFSSVEEIEENKTLLEVEHGGFGFILIKAGVFEKIGKPFFLDQTIMRKGKISYVGEDIAFFYKARKSGFIPYVDPRVRVLHYKTFLI